MMATEKIYRINPVEWNPSPVVALATSIDGSKVAAARGDGSLEIWLVSPGSIGWHCQLTIHGEPNSRISSLIWCPWGLRGSSLGWLISSSIDGSVSEWDLYNLKQKIVLDSIGVSIWQLAAEPCNYSQFNVKKEINVYENGNDIHKIKGGEDDEHSDSEYDINRSDSAVIHEDHGTQDPRLAIACDDGCVRIYTFDLEKLTYNKTLPRVTGRVLSIAWSLDACRIYSGGSDGFIRCWDASLAHEIYRITVGLGGLGITPELCIWSLLALRCGTIVSADSSGSVQFWDSQIGTLLQTHSYHKGDVNALAAAPTHDRVFSAGSDGQVILYKSSSDTVGSGDDKFVSDLIKKWIYVGYVRAHTHDVRALTVAVPISHEVVLPDEKVKRTRGREKPFDFSYPKWANFGVPMLISAGDDTKLFAYSAKEFTKFSPHDICPAPHRMPIQLALKTLFDRTPLLLVQASRWLDIYCVHVRNGAVFEVSPSSSDELTTTNLVARIKCKASRKIICSTISSSGASLAYSDHVKSNLFELKQSKLGKNVCTVKKRKLPWELPYAHCMVFSSDSSKLLIAAYDRRIYVVDVENGELVHVFTPSRTHQDEELPPREPPCTKMFTSIDDQWLAAINCFGDVYIFNLETLRQHWFISIFDGASVTAGGFTPRNSNILIISTSSNHVYAFDVEAKQLGEWSMQHTFSLPRRYQEFSGEVIGLSFPPSASSSRVIVYSPRARCLIDFGMPVDSEDVTERADGDDLRHFSEPVLFVEHLSENHLLVIDKPWMEVVKTLDTPPVHRHIYGI